MYMQQAQTTACTVYIFMLYIHLFKMEQPYMSLNLQYFNSKSKTSPCRLQMEGPNMSLINSYTFLHVHTQINFIIEWSNEGLNHGTQTNLHVHFIRYGPTGICLKVCTSGKRKTTACRFQEEWPDMGQTTNNNSIVAGTGRDL